MRLRSVLMSSATNACTLPKAPRLRRVKIRMVTFEKFILLSDWLFFEVWKRLVCNDMPGTTIIHLSGDLKCQKAHASSRN